jgi:hypothetical protein
LLYPKAILQNAIRVCKDKPIIPKKITMMIIETFFKTNECPLNLVIRERSRSRNPFGSYKSRIIILYDLSRPIFSITK